MEVYFCNWLYAQQCFNPKPTLWNYNSRIIMRCSIYSSNVSMSFSPKPVSTVRCINFVIKRIGSMKISSIEILSRFAVRSYAKRLYGTMRLLKSHKSNSRGIFHSNKNTRIHYAIASSSCISPPKMQCFSR